MEKTAPAGMETRPNEAKRDKGRKRTRFGALMEIWRFQVITGLILIIPAGTLDGMMKLIVNSSGDALTTANLKGLASWRTPMLILLAALLVLLFIVFEILGQIYLSDDLLSGGDCHIFREIGKGFRSVKRFLSPKGLLIALFIAVVVPLCGGIGFSISLTRSFYMPRFISSVIISTPLYMIPYAAGIIAAILFAYHSVFTLHAMLLDDMNASNAQKRSVQLIREHGKDFIKRMLGVAAYSAVILIASKALTQVLFRHIVEMMGEGIPHGHVIDMAKITGESALTQTDHSVIAYRVAGACYILFGTYLDGIVTALAGSNAIIQITRAYFAYTGRTEGLNQTKSRKRFVFLTVQFAAIPVVLLIVSFGMGYFFNMVPAFDNMAERRIVAHRTGGFLASENSLEGIDESVKLGVYGAETDIQRTKDGQYVINHDNTFKRLTGVNKKPGDLTLAEVRQLRIKDTTGSGALLEVPTMEELLDRGKGRITLFLELKGASADKKMADDIVSAVRERDMVDDVVLISLDYNVINYAEKTYPEIKTGILLFAGFGDISKLNCDMLIMEEEMSTTARINEIHAAGKEAGVWTVNTKDAMKHFLNSEADFIITDEVRMAVETQEEMKERSDLEIMEDWALSDGGENG